MNRRDLFLVLSISAFLLLNGCKRSNIPELKVQDTQPTQIVCDLSKGDMNKPLDINKEIDSVKYIRLETTQASLIGELDKVIVSDKYIICIDSDKENTVFLFDNTGRYLGKINQFGKEPNEYLEITACNLDIKNDRLYIYDRAKGRIHIYDMTGKPLGINKIPFVFDYFAWNHDGNLFYNNEATWREDKDGIASSRLFIGDVKGEISQRAFRITPEEVYRKSFGDNPFYYCQEELMYVKSYSDTIYSIKQHTIEAKYYFDFLGKGLSQYKQDCDFYEHFRVNAEKLDYTYGCGIFVRISG
ncbi:6-bladed beta-propeller [Halosquirtibacter laminarini]|uniref:6-bladed beta-propeller n=1 Tax=Halosquirtibacter laminarini TaxID=3374600 RepID=A0AC61NCW6_9BACT|nr:6-bladed beta-propeller [Prolixibacteraceae bacterium]